MESLDFLYTNDTLKEIKLLN